MNNSKDIIKLIAIFAIGLLVGGGVIFLMNYRDVKDVISGQTISTEEAGKKAINVINDILAPQGITASLVGSVSERGLHRVTVNIQEQEINLHVSKDGALLFPEAIDLEALAVAPVPAQVQEEPTECEIFQEELNQEPERKVKIAQCLTERGYKIYYADWCPFCVQQKEMFGEAEKYLYGFDCYDPEGEQGNITKCPDLRGVPAWRDGDGNQLKYNGEVIDGMIQIRRLVEISGCHF